MSDSDSEPMVEEDQALQQYLGTTSFGKQSKEAAIDQQIERSRRAASKQEQEEKAKRIKPAKDSDDDSDSDDNDDDDDEDFPLSHEMVLKTHDRAVTTATIDPSGARLITGSMDCTLKLHDFASMTPTTIRAFRSVDPTSMKGGGSSSNVETHPVHQALFNPISANHVLVCTALPQAKVMTRDGEHVMETAKGDMYLRDMHNTKGHISEITTGTWHPDQRDLFVTAGTDSTLRIWDVKTPRCQKEVIVHKSKAAGSAGRTRMTAVAWGSQAQGGQNVLVAAALDGSLVMWQGEGPYSRPAAEIRDAHVPNTWTSGLDISADGRLVATRGGDDTIKLWDTRKFKTPVTTTSHPSTSSQYPTSSLRFSPTSSHHLLTGSPSGDLHILNPATLRPEHITPITPGHALITATWHAKLNQILTTSANGASHLLYSPTTSANAGARAVFQRIPKQRHIDDDPSLTQDLTAGISSAAIIVPGQNKNATSYSSRHPEVGMTASGKSRDPRRPAQPVVTPFAKGNPDAKYVKDSIPLSSLRDEDPREALLRYAEESKAKGEKDVFTAAWGQTQPREQTRYAELSDDEEEEPAKKKPRAG